MAIKNWLKNSYRTHGNSTDSKSKPSPRNMDDTNSSKMKRVATKNSDMAKTSKAGNKSGGGKSSISNGGAPADGKTTYMKGLMRGNNRGG